MKKALVPLLLILALLLGACGQGGQEAEQGQADQGAIRVALGDIESVETLALFIALEHVRRSEEHTSELQSRQYLVCRLLLEKKKQTTDSSTGGTNRCY